MLDCIRQISLQTANLPYLLKSLNLPPHLLSHRSFDAIGGLPQSSSDRQQVRPIFNAHNVSEVQRVSSADDFEDKDLLSENSVIKNRPSQSIGNLSTNKSRSGSQKQMSNIQLNYQEIEIRNDTVLKIF